MTKIPSEKVLEHFRNEHDKGNDTGKLDAARKCAEYCEREQIPLPHWALSVIVSEQRQTRAALRPNQDALRRQRHEAVFALLRAAKMAGFPDRPSEGQESAREFVTGMVPKLFPFTYKDVGKIVCEQSQIERDHPDRLLMPRFLPAGEVGDRPVEPMTSTDYARMVSGELARRDRRR